MSTSKIQSFSRGHGCCSVIGARLFQTKVIIRPIRSNFYEQDLRRFDMLETWLGSLCSARGSHKLSMEREQAVL